MKRREMVAVLAAGAIAEVSASEAQNSQARYANEIALPKRNLAGAVSPEEAIERLRRPARALALPAGQTVVYLIPAGFAA